METVGLALGLRRMSQTMLSPRWLLLIVLAGAVPVVPAGVRAQWDHGKGQAVLVRRCDRGRRYRLFNLREITLQRRMLGVDHAEQLFDPHALKARGDAMREHVSVNVGIPPNVTLDRIVELVPASGANAYQMVRQPRAQGSEYVKVLAKSEKTQGRYIDMFVAGAHESASYSRRVTCYASRQGVLRPRYIELVFPPFCSAPLGQWLHHLEQQLLAELAAEKILPAGLTADSLKRQTTYVLEEVELPGFSPQRYFGVVVDEWHTAFGLESDSQHTIMTLVQKPIPAVAR